MLTEKIKYAIIQIVATQMLVCCAQTGIEQIDDYYMERYRSGHNEAVLKTVCPKGRVGSNPTLSAILITRKDLVLFFSFTAFGEVLKQVEEAPLLRA